MVRTMHRLRELREERFLSQRALAKKAGVAEATILLAETGRRTPYRITLRKLAAALGVPPAELLDCGPAEGAA